MGFVKGSFFIGFLFILNCVSCIFANEEIKTYVVHLGARQHDDPDVVAESHQRMLESVFESSEDARESIIYNYHHGFSGFAARLTGSQAKKLSERPDVFQVSPNKRYQLLGTRVSEYLGLLPELPGGILQDSDMGSELVIGFLDGGIWPESESYNDKGLGPIPKHWKGECVAGQHFDPAKHCNKKLVGAKYFFDGFAEKTGGAKLDPFDHMSARGLAGHGTLVSSVAASSFVPNASADGLAPGVMRGTAPKARIAMYKISWEAVPMGATKVDMLKAIDEAIKDNVDVLSISIGSPGPYEPYNADTDEIDIDIGSFHAVTKGIPVIAAGGNSGPDPYTAFNVAPWLFTVGATSLDRTFHVDMTLGNNITIPAQATYRGEEVFADLIYVQDLEKLTDNVEGKVVLTFVKDDSQTFATQISFMGRAAGLIVARTSDSLPEDVLQGALPIQVDYEVGYKILQYIHSSSSPTVKISTGRTLVGRPIPSTVAGFSSRGPNSAAPAILKPDIAAPGMFVLGAYTQNSRLDYKFTLAVGTSFAAPIVAGIVTLLKALHPEWSPAALKSAVMTSAWKTDPYGEPIYAEGQPRKLATPFDFGSGLVNAERARDPGLVYDMNLDDYIHYFCATGYNDTAITLLTGKPTTCGTPLPSILDVNYPAITIPDLNGEVTLTRTVTNVGPVDSVYRAVIEPPQGIKIVVEPETLQFSSSTKILGFKVRVSKSRKRNSAYVFGSFTWTDGTRNVTIPLSVRTRV